MTSDRLKLVIFDLDGTLIDSVAVIIETVHASFGGLGLPLPDEHAIRSISGLNLEIALQRLAPAMPVQQLPELMARYKQEFLARVSEQVREPLFPGALHAVETLAARDDVVLAVATGKALRGAERVLGVHGIRHHFQTLQTPDHNASKPDPEMIFSAIAHTGADVESTIMIGDTNHDMEMAKAAGVAGIGVTWGYHTPDVLQKAGAARLINQFGELIPTIEELIEAANA